MSHRRYLFVIIFVLTVPCTTIVTAQSMDEVNSWSQRLARGSAAALTDSPTPWPVLKVHSATGSLRPGAEPGVLLAQRLRERLQLEAAVVAAADGESRLLWSLSSFGAASRLEAVGGYTNIVLAQAIRRVALDAIFISVRNGAKPSAALIDSLSQGSLTNTMLNSLLDESDLSASDRQLVAGETDTNAKFFRYIGLYLHRPGSGGIRQARFAPTSELVKRRQMGELLFQLQVSEAAARLGLYPYCLAVSDGADPAKLLTDRDEFSKRFGALKTKIDRALGSIADGVSSSGIQVTSKQFSSNKMCSELFCQSAIQ